MKKYLSVLSFACMAITAYAQNFVSRHSGGKIFSYYYETALQSAVSEAKSGDTIFISGGMYSAPSAISLTKLTIIGAGYHPDSTKATKPSIISGNIHLATGDSSTLEGIYINGSLVLGGYTDSINFIRIHRCYIESDILIEFNSRKLNKYITITESNFKSFDGRNKVKYLRISNSIIRQQIMSINEISLIENNIFTFSNQYQWWPLISGVHYSVVRNNIINNSSNGGFTVTGSTNNLFSNNLWAEEPGYDRINNDTAKEVIKFSMDTVWANLQDKVNFSFNNDYHLRSRILNKYKGTDGTQPGIYGGPFSPWKEGAVPRNPHIQSVWIDRETDSGGKLKVNIKVQAQKR